MNAEKLKKILDNHAKWLRGRGGERANLEGANLERANLEGANLERAYLEMANLERANLGGANLFGANLFGAYLEGANLFGAYLGGANLERANLGGHLIRTWLFAEYNCQYLNGRLKIGCQEHTTTEWASFTEGQIRRMDGDRAVRFWKSVDYRCVLVVCDSLDQQTKERIK